MKPKVSVVIAHYNGAAFIAEALKSALTQTLRDIEVIVVDNCSTDGGYEIIQALAAIEPRLRVYQTERNSGGPSVPRNIGIDNARGDWIAIMDSDDLMERNRLATLLDHARLDDADIVADDLRIFTAGVDQTSRVLSGDTPFWLTPLRYIESNRFFGDELPLGLLKPMIRANLLNEIRYQPDLHMAEDWDLVVRLLLRGARMRVYPERMYCYRKHEGSISHRLTSDKLMPVLRYSMRLMQTYRADETIVAALRDRHEDILRAMAFTELVDAIKKREVIRCLKIGFRNPGAVRLLKFPMRARLRQLGARFGFPDTPVALK